MLLDLCSLFVKKILLPLNTNTRYILEENPTKNFLKLAVCFISPCLKKANNGSYKSKEYFRQMHIFQDFNELVKF